MISLILIAGCSDINYVENKNNLTLNVTVTTNTNLSNYYTKSQINNIADAMQDNITLMDLFIDSLNNNVTLMNYFLNNLDDNVSWIYDHMLDSVVVRAKNGLKVDRYYNMERLNINTSLNSTTRNRFAMFNGGQNLISTNLINYTSNTLIFNSNTSFNGGMFLPSVTVLPTCNSARRGQMYFVRNSGIVADAIWVCSRTALETFVWVAV